MKYLIIVLSFILLLNSCKNKKKEQWIQHEKGFQYIIHEHKENAQKPKLGDVLVLKLLLSKLKEIVELEFPHANPVEKMVDLTNTPIVVKSFKFGKHKGKSLEDVAREDAGYLRWMLSSMENLDDDMRYSINLVLGN